MTKDIGKSTDILRYPRVENIELGIINMAYSNEELQENAPEAEKEGAGTLPLDSTVEQTLSVSEQNDKTLDTNNSDKDEETLRDRWDNPVEFLMSCVSMSVGLGNVWRFPFTAYENGGASFLIPYLIVLLLLGRPMYYLEMCLGQFSSYGPVKVWEISPIFKGVGYASMLAVVCTMSFYCSIMAITVYYFYISFADPLPWSPEVCTRNNTNNDVALLCELQRNGANRSFSEIFYLNSVFPQLDNIDNGIGSIHWKLAICLFISWAIIYVFLVKGIKSSGKVSYFTAMFPYAVLIALLIRGMTLPGAMDGIIYFLKPDWTKLLDARVWFNSVAQCFFSLNVGFGTIVYLSSHNRFRHNIYRDAIVLSITDTLTSCLAGCAIFSLLGYLANTLNTDIENVTKGGFGLAFIAFPESIAHLKLFPQGFAVLFFLMLFTLGVGSAMAFVGHVVAVILDQYPAWRKWRVALAVCALGLASGMVYITQGGQFILTLVNHNGADFIIFTTAMIEIMAVSWVYGVNRFCDDIKFMLGRETEIYWKICWAFIMPVGLFAILIYFFATHKNLLHDGAPLPTTALVSGWVLTGGILSTLPIFAIKAVRESPGDTWFEKLKTAVKPMESWGPKAPSDRIAWLEMKESREREKSRKRSSIDRFSTASTAPPASTSSS